MDINKNRKQILDQFLKNISYLSNRSYQKRVWVLAEGPECGDIDDVVCDFFDDGDPILENYKEFAITENQLKILRDLHNKLRVFTDTFAVYSPNKSTDNLIKMSEWHEICFLAKRVSDAFHTS
jgi:hypothetical protein